MLTLAGPVGTWKAVGVTPGLLVTGCARFRTAPLWSGLSGSPLSQSRYLTTSEIGNMKIILSLVVLCLVTAVASAQTVPVQDPLLGETTVKVSDHVWAIMGWPNIGIVVGENATLVVDTGLGPRNGATVARVAKKLAAQ